MPFCEKCGALIADDVRFCDKCGAPTNFVQLNSETSGRESDIKLNSAEFKSTAIPKDASVPSPGAEHVAPSAYPAYAYSPAPAKKSLIETVFGILPSQYTTPGDKTMFWVGFSSILALAVTYLVCMFVFMADICAPISKVADYGIKSMVMEAEYKDAATPVWMIVYMVMNFLPAYFAVMSLKNSNYKRYSVYFAIIFLFVTVVALIGYGSIETKKVVAEGLYGESSDKLAWYTLCDCLSEAWYLKLILPIGVVLGFGVDNYINKAK